MPKEGVTTTGLAEMEEALRKFPEEEVKALREVAHASAVRELSTAKATLRGQQKTGVHALADAIRLIDHENRREWLVVSFPPPGQPENLPIWNEYGTIKMDARHYMRSASDQENDTYRHNMEAAAEEYARRVFQG